MLWDWLLDQQQTTALTLLALCVRLKTLAWRIGGRRARHRPDDASPEPGRLRYAIRGFTIQMTNPKAALAWIAIISLGLQKGAPLWVGFAIVVGTAVLSTVIHCLCALTFSTRTIVHLYGRARR